MDKIYVFLIIFAALALLYILWCLAEPFFLGRDRATLKKSPKDLTDADDLTIKKLPMVRNDINGDPDFRFFFISDTHTEWCPVTSDRICKSIREANSAAALDAVIFGGDIITSASNADRGYKYLNNISACCKELGIPFYGITGNHDIKLTNKAENAGYETLDHKQITLTSRTSGSRAVLMGLPDSGRKERQWYKMPAAVEDLPVILVVHDPDALLHFAPETRPDFMLSGHLHGGQMKFPFRIEFCVLRRHDRLPNMGAVQGAYNIGGTTVFISRGLGCGVMPFRFLSLPEATVTEIYL